MNLKTIINKSVLELANYGIATADIDVRAILQNVLDKDDIYLVTHNEDLLTNSQYQKFRRYIRRRKKGEPIAYIVGYKEFYGLDFLVNKNVLIPRPETEVLVETALQFLGKKLKEKGENDIRIQPNFNNLETDETNPLTADRRPPTIIDLGTGSGCIIISLVKNLSLSAIHLSPCFYASDISPKALAVATKNAKKHRVYDNIRFLKSDLFSNEKLPKEFDLIIANLPYLDKNETARSIDDPHKIGLKFEPQEALYADKKGLSVINKMISMLPKHLSKNGIALIEVDKSHKAQIVEMAHRYGLTAESVINSSGYDGFFIIHRK